MEAKKVDVTIIIINYNLTESVRILLESIRKFISDLSFEVIIVDNNSSDRSIEELTYEYPEFTFVLLSTNYGFAHGNNIGFSRAHGDYLLLLNPDTYLVNNLPLKLLRFAKENPTFGIIGPKLVYPNGNFQTSFAKFPNLKQEIVVLFGGISNYFNRVINVLKYKHFNQKSFYQVDFIFGSCMMINSELFENLGGFDEDFFLFSEEADLCYRTWQTDAYKVIYNPSFKIVHIKSQITGKNNPERIRISYESKLKFYKKHYSKLKVFALKYFIILMFLIKKSLLSNSKEKYQYKEKYQEIINYYLKN